MALSAPSVVLLSTPEVGAPNHFDLQQQLGNMTPPVAILEFLLKSKEPRWVLASCLGRGLDYSLSCSSSKSHQHLRVFTEVHVRSWQNRSASKDGDLQECGPEEDRQSKGYRARQHYNAVLLQNPFPFCSTI